MNPNSRQIHELNIEHTFWIWNFAGAHTWTKKNTEIIHYIGRVRGFLFLRKFVLHSAVIDNYKQIIQFSGATHRLAELVDTFSKSYKLAINIQNIYKMILMLLW